MSLAPIVLGSLAQAAVFAALLVVVQPPTGVYAATPAVAGVVAGVSSGRFRSLYVDTGGAALGGTLLSLATAGVVMWQNLAAVPIDARIDLTFLTLLFGVGALIFLLPVAIFVGVVVGHLAAVIRDEMLVS
ncbi:hypothetical protein NGM10_15000 [Halorussus salilacus]|uniref:hypothetical protein n=1 Tax=Halorussus salilacus TaxID=2953750 RepID=UPI00209E4A16|nr:hypothetical protein [Halorussus salilacus]USZ68027.1 hypothetical protein NGM10_15000 [Halorussus salilacus]